MNLGGTVRISRCGMMSLLASCAIIIIYYLATNHHVEGSLAHTIKQQLNFGTKTEAVDLRRMLAVAIQAAERGGAEVTQVRKDADLSVQSKGKTREGINDPLTDGDIRSHYQMYHGIKKMFPGVVVISEEKNRPKDAHPDILPIKDHNSEVQALALEGLDEPVPIEDITVWIDPLDATKEYTENKLQYVTTMVCVAVRGVPVIGVVHQPFKDAGVTYWAWTGHGHSASLEVVPPPSKLPDPLKVLVSMSHPGETEAYARKAFGNVEMVPAAGAGYKTLAKLWGLGDVYVHTTLIKKWDTCAPDALLRATGGRMSTLRGEEISYVGTEQDKREKIEHGILATSVKFHGQLLADVARIENRT